MKEERQITSYFKGDVDFRLMNTSDYLKLWLKTGKIHDDAREEMSVIIDKKYEKDLLKMLDILGYEIEIKWYRKRLELTFKDFEVTIDYTVGYGYIVEFELMVEDDKKIEEAKNKLNEVFKEFNIADTPNAVFNKKIQDYKVNWHKYTKDVNDNEFLIEK
ncbi:MAG: CYTH domain-containing protein [Mollicutes bacterium]|nr:CYTH domain-containing protein [Mollicutes bacterium]